MNVLKMSAGEKSQFRQRLLRWYDRHGRPLPWRETQEPYAIWVSEIMLQQTRVNAVLEHYRRFRERFPTVFALASASEAEVLAAWSGLGYYRRARMMRRAAQEIVQAHGGEFPKTAAALQELPGIGRYTAAAIASIAYGERRAVVDGNVERVVGRMAGKALSQKAIWEFAESAISAGRPGDFNQAMMELGAMVCTPKNPACGECPVKSFCRSRGREPVAKQQAERKNAVVKYVFALERGRVRLVQRSEAAGQMAGMWELPQVDAAEGKAMLKLRHSITSTDFEVEIFKAKSQAGQWIRVKDAGALPLTGLTRKVLTRMGAFASKS